LQAYFDNDIIHKLAKVNLLDEVLQAFSIPEGSVHILHTVGDNISCTGIHRI
jgi:hypothetical protein